MFKTTLKGYRRWRRRFLSFFRAHAVYILHICTMRVYLWRVVQDIYYIRLDTFLTPPRYVHRGPWVLSFRCWRTTTPPIDYDPSFIFFFFFVPLFSFRFFCLSKRNETCFYAITLYYNSAIIIIYRREVLTNTVYSRAESCPWNVVV